MKPRRLASPVRHLVLASATTLLLTGCGSTDTRASPEPPEAPSPTEVAGAEPRIAVTYDGGVQVLDATTGEVLLDTPVDGFTRLSPAGDDRHVMVSRSAGFTALDLGTWTEAHGDHGHSWTTEPALTAFELDAQEPGHVVAHAGRTTVFDDGTGTITAFDSADLGRLAEASPRLDTWAAEEAHHGVAAQAPYGPLIHSVGTADSRTGVRVITPEGIELAESSDCPGLHGEAHLGKVVAFGCEDGVLLVDGTRFTKADSPDPYGRIGNQAGHESSPYLLGDYKTDVAAELERPSRVALVDARDASLRLVDLGTSYSFRSLGRTPDGDGLVLGTDGALHLVDAGRGRVTASLPVVEPWREPLDWQLPRPTLQVVGGTAYVTEPAADRVQVIDLATLEVRNTLDLSVTPNELSGVAG